MAKKHPADKYASDVVAGKVPTGKYVVRACQRHLDDLKTGKARGLRFDKGAAKHALDFFEFLHHSKGEWAGQAFLLEPWQQFIIWSVFGWLRADGLRRFRTAYIEIPRKNGKSTLAAGIGLYMFFADNEPGAEVYTAATKRDQARITHGEAERMVRASGALNKRINIVRDNMHILGTASKFEPLGADADTMDGLNIQCAIMDELHAHKNRKMDDVIETATGSRRQPLVFKITTAGHDRHSVCFENHDYSCKVLDGILTDDTVFSFIAGLDEGDDWRDPANWIKANPNWGVSAKPDDIARLAAKAMEMPTAQNGFRRLRLNEWTEQETRWLDMGAWDQCPAELDVAALAGRRAFAALDLSTKIDLTARALVFPPDTADGIWPCLFKFYIPGDNIQDRVRRDRVPYDVWVRDGLITATPGNVVDYEYIKQDLIIDAASYKVVEVGFDPWAATQLAVQLELDGFKMVEMRQGHKTMAEPTKELEALVKARRLATGAHPVLRWMASNVVVRMGPNETFMPDKNKSSERIDGIVALLMALGRAIVTVQAESVYSKRGIFTVG